MGHSYTGVEGGLGDFTVTKSNPSTTVVRFAVTDTAKLLTSPKMVRAVLNDAIDQWIALERTDLNTNGDATVKGSDEHPGTGDGFSKFNYDYSNKRAEVTLTALTGISTTGTITASIPYADVA